MAWAPGLVAEIWSQLYRPVSFDWRLKPAALERLFALSPTIKFESASGEPTEFNRELRRVISPLLCKGDPAVRRALIAWIIVEWGGIKRNHTAKMDDFAHRLGSFEDAKIEEFVASRGTVGVSSWSKIIALARPDEHAVYDARTSVALNCVLFSLGEQRAFAMPQSQSRVIQPAATRLKRRRRELGLRGGWSGYNNYIHLLRAMVALPVPTAPTCILDAEMQIFAVAPEIANEFLST